MSWLEIRPRDVWLFRDGKPFAAGEDHSAYSMFPPTPLTLQGALRQKIAESLGVSFAEYKAASTPQAWKAIAYIGPWGKTLDTGKFCMAGPFVSLRLENDVVPLFPAPADLLHSEQGKWKIASPSRSVKSDLGDNVLFPEVQPDYENMPDGWLAADVFTDYLNGKAPAQKVYYARETATMSSSSAAASYAEGKRVWHSQALYLPESRFGVSIEAKTNYRKEGHLYQVQYVRPREGIGLLVSVESVPSDLLRGDMVLGGEQRHAVVETASVSAFPERSTPGKGRFKVVFLTPAYFAGGWQPTEGDWSYLFEQQPVRLIGAALYRPLRIGGWNGAANRPRTMHNYVAPGSVYYFEAEEALDRLPDALTENPEEIADAAAIGFGQYAVGKLED